MMNIAATGAISMATPLTVSAPSHTRLARSVAIAGSPLFELGTILRTPRLSGARERSMAWLCLIRIRLYRAYAMIRHALNANARSARNDWTRSR